jgi:hypothetical protein
MSLAGKWMELEGNHHLKRNMPDLASQKIIHFLKYEKSRF